MTLPSTSLCHYPINSVRVVEKRILASGQVTTNFVCFRSLALTYRLLNCEKQKDEADNSGLPLKHDDPITGVITFKSNFRASRSTCLIEIAAKKFKTVFFSAETALSWPTHTVLLFKIYAADKVSNFIKFVINCTGCIAKFLTYDHCHF